MSAYGAGNYPGPNPAAGQFQRNSTPASYTNPPGTVSNNVSVPHITPNIGQAGPFEGVSLQDVYQAVAERISTLRTERDHPDGAFVARLSAVFEVATLHRSFDEMWRRELPVTQVANETDTIDVLVTHFPGAVARRIANMGPATAPVNMSKRIRADVVKFAIGMVGSTNHRFTENGRRVWMQEIAVCLQSFHAAGAIYMHQCVLTEAYTRGASTWRLGINKSTAVTDAINRSISTSFANHLGCMGTRRDGHEQTVNALDSVLKASDTSHCVENLYMTVRHARQLTRFQNEQRRSGKYSSEAARELAEKGQRNHQAVPMVNEVVVHPMPMGHGVDNFDPLSSTTQIGLYYPSMGAINKVRQARAGEYTRAGDFVNVYDFVSDSARKFSMDEADRHAQIIDPATGQMDQDLLVQMWDGPVPPPARSNWAAVAARTTGEFYKRARMGYLVRAVADSSAAEAKSGTTSRTFRDADAVMSAPAANLDAASIAVLAAAGIPMFWSYIAAQPHIRLGTEGVMATSRGGLGFSVVTPLRTNIASSLNRTDYQRFEMGMGAAITNQDRVAIAPATSVTHHISGGSAVPHDENSMRRVMANNDDANTNDESVIFIPVRADEIGPLTELRTFDLLGYYPTSSPANAVVHYSTAEFVIRRWNITANHGAITAQEYVAQIGAPIERCNTTLWLGPTLLSYVTADGAPRRLEGLWPGQWCDGWFGKMTLRTGNGIPDCTCATDGPS